VLCRVYPCACVLTNVEYRSADVDTALVAGLDFLGNCLPLFVLCLPVENREVPRMPSLGLLNLGDELEPLRSPVISLSHLVCRGLEGYCPGQERWDRLQSGQEAQTRDKRQGPGVRKSSVWPQRDSLKTLKGRVSRQGLKSKRASPSGPRPLCIFLYSLAAHSSLLTKIVGSSSFQPLRTSFKSAWWPGLDHQHHPKSQEGFGICIEFWGVKSERKRL